MNDWNEGYFTGSTYTYGYYRELSPAYQRFILLANGFSVSAESDESIHCELGFGQGVSINIHAASNPGYFIGTDFNPAHSSHANDLLKSFSSEEPRIKFFDDSFEQMLDRDLPQFDSISLHGIWTWISTENQKRVVEFARKFLKPGGIFYNSYNVFPGWAPKSPLRELLILHDKFSESNSSTKKRVEDAIQFIQNFVAADPVFLKTAPGFKPMLDMISKQSPDYIAHEFLNRDWICMYFTEVLEMLSDAKLDFACTTELIELYDNLNFNQAALSFLNKIENPIMREQVKDYFLNRQFRKDLFVRGARKISQVESMSRLAKIRFALTTSDEVKPDFQTVLGNIKIAPEVQDAVIQYLKTDNYRPKSIEEIAQATKSKNPLQTLIILTHRGVIAPCQSDESIKKVKKRCDKLNAYICSRAEFNTNIVFLASPVTGGGFHVNKSEMLVLNSIRHGKKNSKDIARDIWQSFVRTGERISKEGKRLETMEENLPLLEDMAKTVIDKKLSIFHALQII